MLDDPVSECTTEKIEAENRDVLVSTSSFLPCSWRRLFLISTVTLLCGWFGNIVWKVKSRELSEDQHEHKALQQVPISVWQAKELSDKLLAWMGTSVNLACVTDVSGEAVFTKLDNRGSSNGYFQLCHQKEEQQPQKTQKMVKLSFSLKSNPDDTIIYTTDILLDLDTKDGAWWILEREGQPSSILICKNRTTQTNKEIYDKLKQCQQP